MSKGDTFENDLLKLIFTATAIANIADNASSSPLTNLYVALHVSDPGEAGNQSNNEAAYTGYARVAVARNATGWTVTNNNVANTGNINFPACNGATGNTVTHVSVGCNANANSKLLYSGALSANLAVSNGITPVFDAGNLVVSED